MKELLGVLLAFSIASNISLWINIWNLKCRHFEFEEITQSQFRDFLKIFCKEPTKDCPGQSSKQAAE